MWDMMGWGGGWGPGWWGFGLMHVLWWVLVIVAIVYVVRGLGGQGRDDSAQAILRERYARGEIDKSEFDERMRALKTTRGRGWGG